MAKVTRAKSINDITKQLGRILDSAQALRANEYNGGPGDVRIRNRVLAAANTAERYQGNIRTSRVYRNMRDMLNRTPGGDGRNADYMPVGRNTYMGNSNT